VPCLPARIQLQHLRDQADSLLRDAGSGDRAALHRIGEVSDAPTIAYMAMLRFDHERLGLPRELPGTGAVVKALIAAGAPIDGDVEDNETPLITAASYGDAEVARVLIDAGADVNARSREGSGELAGLSALMHAAVFGMTDVLDALVAAGAKPDGIESAAAAGDVSGWLDDRSPQDARIRALVMAADHQRLVVIDQLLDAGTPIDASDDYGRQPLRIAAERERSASVEHLLARGADPGVLGRLSQTDG
jgi:ankyrin repeat protein